ncbi:MAG TPA: TolC family protein [Vicinamibacterales bacterium]|nr:TolC family protein [Vicinamibacterales bacterium]
MTSERTPFIVVLLLFVVVATAPTASAQSALSLAEAIRRARTQNPDVGTAAATEREAAERVTQARGGYFPRVEVAESWQRGDHPVFVFSSRLAQRQFSPADFALDALNRPAATNNFRATLSVEQPLFDRTTAAHVRAATIGLDMAATGRRLVSLDLASTVTEAFGRVLIAAGTVRSAAAAVETARADRELAGNRRDAGRATDADLLQLDVHLTRTLEQQVQATSDEHIARARLNQLMGEPLTAAFSLDSAPPASTVDITNSAALEEEAVQNRPEVSLARHQERLAAATADAAQAAFLPQVSAQGAWELNGGTWNSRSSSWVVGATARITLFRGLADRARLAEAREQVTRRGIEKSKAETTVRLDVQITIARLVAARASEAVGRAAVDSARASHRIIRDRYECGLADAAMLLRAAEAIQEAEARQVTAFVNLITATATLQRATGRL